jgi:hypothetical protein
MKSGGMGRADRAGVSVPIVLAKGEHAGLSGLPSD